MIWLPTFSTSTTPISITSEVVLIMRVARLMAWGTSRRAAWGSSTNRQHWPRVRPRAALLSRWWTGMEVMAPRTRSPISPAPQKVNTATAAVSPEIWMLKALARPK